MNMASYSGFWDQTGDAKQYALLVDRNPKNRRLMMALRRKSMRITRSIIDSITTSNSVAAVDYDRIVAPLAADAQGTSVVNGGVRPIETLALRASGNATAVEVDDIRTMTRYDAQPDPYPIDAGGNGGGGKGSNVAPALG